MQSCSFEIPDNAIYPYFKHIFNEFKIIIIIIIMMMMMMMMMMMIKSVYCCVQPKICLLETWYLNFFRLQVLLFIFVPFKSLFQG